MERVLGTAGLATVVVNGANQDFERALNGQGTNIILSVANALWYQNGAGAKSDFVTSCRQYFGATVDGLDFADPRSVGAINAWASEKTHGKITSIAVRRLLGGQVSFYDEKERWAQLQREREAAKVAEE